jgi:hypothetical protein
MVDRMKELLADALLECISISQTERGLTLHEVLYETGVPIDRLVQYCTGKAEDLPDFALVARLHHLAGRDCSELLARAGEMAPSQYRRSAAPSDTTMLDGMPVARKVDSHGLARRTLLFQATAKVQQLADSADINRADLQ